MSKQILLADDSITIQKVIALTFAGEDYKITAVDNGADAIAKAREIKPDIILADVVMPQKNGYEVCQITKNDPELRSIPVLLLAGTFEPFDEDEAKKAGADGYIIKPFESQAVIQKVRDLITAKAEQPLEQKPEVPVAPEITAPVPSPAPEPIVAIPTPPPTQPAVLPVVPAPPVPVTPPVSPAVAPAAHAEADFWGTMMEEVEEKAAPEAKAPAAKQAEVPSEEVWDAGEFEEEAPAAKEEKEEDIWESFAFEDTEVKGEVMEAPLIEEAPVDEELTFVSEGIPIGEGLTPVAEEAKEEVAPSAEIEVPAAEIPEIEELEEVTVVEPEEEPIEIVEEEAVAAGPEEVTPVPETAEVFAAPPAVVETQPEIVAGYEQTFEPEEISREPSELLPAGLEGPPPAPSAAALSEEQLRAALSQVSRDVIEKIVWEVVPDLAEMLIKEEIKRLQGKK